MRGGRHCRRRAKVHGRRDPGPPVASPRGGPRRHPGCGPGPSAGPDHLAALWRRRSFLRSDGRVRRRPAAGRAVHRVGCNHQLDGHAPPLRHHTRGACRRTLAVRCVASSPSPSHAARARRSRRSTAGRHGQPLRPRARLASCQCTRPPPRAEAPALRRMYIRRSHASTPPCAATSMARQPTAAPRCLRFCRAPASLVEAQP